ncbi:hypothetical protein EMN47_07465 [Prolixibacteraceae bacterium JC049]|nr:hypothetical protein [Prolixibacteraceae bacterium JC049]
MENQLKKYDQVQVEIFNDIKNKIGNNVSLVESVADLLDLSSDAAYRRIRGAKELGINELLTLCTHFNISLDNIMSLSNDHVMFRYKSLDFSKIEDYFSYMEDLASTFKSMSQAENKEVVFAANDIPIFHFLQFKELAIFKIFAWINSIEDNGTVLKFSDFMNSVASEGLYDCYNRIATGYQSIPSTEIWTVKTIDPIISLIEFYTEAGYFETFEMPLKLCKQLLELIDMIKNWCATQQKNQHENGEFKLYLSDVELENSFVLFTEDEQKSCLVKLYTINSLQTKHGAFINETERWIKSAINKSLLLTGASQKERHKFFNQQECKVNSLINRIKKLEIELRQEKICH